MNQSSTSFDLANVYPRIADLASAQAAFLFCLLSSIRSPTDAHRNLTGATIDELEKIIDSAADLTNWRRRIDVLLEQLNIPYSTRATLAKAPALNEGTYEVAELLRDRYGEEAMWLFSAYGNLQTYGEMYAHTGVTQTVLKILEANLDQLQLPRHIFGLLERMSYKHNDDPRPSRAFLKWYSDFKRNILAQLIERRISYFRSREDFEVHWEKICADEQRFTQEILAPLMMCIGSENVHYVHGADEYGRDLVWSYRSPLGQTRFCAAQVKALQISGSATSILNTLLSQLDDAFRMPIVLPQGRVHIAEFYLITSKSFTRNAIAKIVDKISNPVVRNNTHFYDGQKIKELTLQFLRPVNRGGLKNNAQNDEGTEA